VDLTRRVHRLEERNARWLAQQIKDDPRWADPDFRREVRDAQLRLQAEEEENARLRAVYRLTTATMWEFAGQPERAARIRRGEGYLPDEYQAAHAALGEDGRRQLRDAALIVRQRLALTS
jgi:hypothetical protein